jgi:dTDP-4-dehydrorhamnose 3,5-epimerase
MYCWDARPTSPSHGIVQTDVIGIDKPMLVIVPPGVVHAYKNVGGEQGLVFNCPDRLFKGRGRKEPVDEIRHEDDPQSRFRLD